MKNKKLPKKKNNLALLFRKSVVSKYEYDRAAKNEKGGTEHFLQYLINRNIVENITIRRYTILEAFDLLYPKYNYHKSNTVEALAMQFELSERQIWTILKDHRKRFD